MIVGKLSDFLTQKFKLFYRRSQFCYRENAVRKLIAMNQMSNTEELRIITKIVNYYELLKLLTYLLA